MKEINIKDKPGIKISKKIYELLKESFEKNNIKRIYFIRWKENIKIEEGQIIGRKRIKSVKRVILKKKEKNINIEEDDDKSKEIADKKKDMMDIDKEKDINQIEIKDKIRINIEDNKELIDKTKNDGKETFEEKAEIISNLKEGTKIESEIIKEKPKSQLTEDINDKTKNEKDKEKNEKEIYNNIVKMLKKGDKVQRKESKKKLLNIINNLDDEKSLQFKLITNIKERTYKLLKEVFEKNNIKRKYFLIWKNAFGISKRTHRKSIKRIILTKKKKQPEKEIKEKEEKRETNIDTTIQNPTDNIKDEKEDIVKDEKR